MNLAQRQALSLDEKIILTQERIRQWYAYWDGLVYVAFSGGKDSTVLKHLVETTPGVHNVPSVFCNTGLEYPEIVHFVRAQQNVTEIRPKMTFKKVIEKYGYPVISKEQALYIRQLQHDPSDALYKLRTEGNAKGIGRVSKKWRFVVDAPFAVSEKCCDILKKRPFHAYDRETARHPMLGIMATEGNLRLRRYGNQPCNQYEKTNPTSTPMIFWSESDVLTYIQRFDLAYASVYGDIVGCEGTLTVTGEPRTGCLFCMFGVQHDNAPNRFQRMAQTHPRHYTYCINELGLGAVLDYLGMEWE
jgi:3'-phosphoadenosine 5'-phosphosulfate sulfotransferase (PAPS reductase)/FAD synthetase